MNLAEELKALSEKNKNSKNIKSANTYVDLVRKEARKVAENGDTHYRYEKVFVSAEVYPIIQKMLQNDGFDVVECSEKGISVRW